MGRPLNKWKTLSNPVKASIVFLIATILLKGIVFITTPIFTRLMSVSDIGIVGTYQSWKGIFEVFAILSMTSAGIFNVGMSKYRDYRDKYISNMICLCAFLSLIFGGLTWLSYDKISFILQIPKSLIILMFLYAFIMPSQSFWLAKQRYEYKYKAAFFVMVLVTVFSQLVSILAVYFAHNNLAEVRLWATALVDLPAGCFFIILLLRRGKQAFNKKIWGETLKFAIPLIPHYLSSIVLTASDRIMINVLDSSRAAGIYTVVHGVGAIISIIWGAIAVSSTPYIYDKLDKGEVKGIDSLTKKIVIGYGSIAVLICLFAPEIIRILAPKTYLIGIYAIPPIIGATFISCLYNLFSNIEFYHRKSIFIAFASIIAAITNVVLNYLLIPKYGFIIAGYTTLISYIILTVMHYFNMRRIEKRDIYDSKRLNAIAFVLLISCILPVFLYKMFLIRYIFIFIIGLILFIKRGILTEILFKKINN